MASTRLFVYGTLKRGLRNHHLIAAQEFLGEASTEPKYRVIDLGTHPGLVVDERNGLSIHGELWAVSDACLAELDAFEEVPGPFIRAEVAIEGKAEPAHAYLWNCPIPEGAATGSEWPM
jgi:gamma-glutamylaminecyclotransferase